MTTLANVPYAQLKVGDTATYERTLTERDLVLFATVSGDHNPIHLDQNFAAQTPFAERIAHGMWTGSLISAALAMKLPGPGGIYRSQELKFLHPVKINDTVTIELEVLEKNERTNSAVIATHAVNQDGKLLVRGKATVIPATEEVTVTTGTIPKVTIG